MTVTTLPHSLLVRISADSWNVDAGGVTPPIPGEHGSLANIGDILNLGYQVVTISPVTLRSTEYLVVGLRRN